MQREVPGDPGAGTSSYWVMPSNTATKISTIFRDRVITELIYHLISAAMVSMMFRRLIWIHFFYHFLAIHLYHEFLSPLTVILTSHFSNITYCRQQPQQNKPMKYYEILPTHTETPRNATRKIANLYIEFNYHFLTFPKEIPFLLNRSVYDNKLSIWTRTKVVRRKQIIQPTGLITGRNSRWQINNRSHIEWYVTRSERSEMFSAEIEIKANQLSTCQNLFMIVFCEYSWLNWFTTKPADILTANGAYKSKVVS